MVPRRTTVNARHAAVGSVLAVGVLSVSVAMAWMAPPVSGDAVRADTAAPSAPAVAVRPASVAIEASPSAADGVDERPCLPLDVEIVYSDPADGFVDARQGRDRSGQADGVSEVWVSFDRPVWLTRDCVDVLSTAEYPPQVLELWPAEGDGLSKRPVTDWLVMLDGPVPACASTAVVFARGVASVVFHSHPGDVNLDGVSDREDVAALKDAVQAGSSHLARYDINRDGRIDAADVTRLASLVETDGGCAGGRDGSLRIDPESKVICCCAWTDCTVFFATGCDDGDTEVDCPCVPNPCRIPVPGPGPGQ